MSQEWEDSQEWNDDPFDSPYFQHILNFVVSRDVNNIECYNAIFAICNDVGDFKELKTDLLYLEYANWNVDEALLQQELDDLDCVTFKPYDDVNENSNNPANKSIDQTLAKPGENFDPSLCQLKVVIDGNKKTFQYPHAKKMDSDNQNDINKLNRWRHKTIRKHIGFPNFESHTGTKFHPLEEVYLLNRYAAQEVDESGRCRYEDITRDHNAVFEDTLLPGRLCPCGTRTKDSITSLLTRRAVNPRSSNGWPKHWNAVMRHEAAQKKIQEDWAKRCEANNAK